MPTFNQNLAAVRPKPQAGSLQTEKANARTDGDVVLFDAMVDADWNVAVVPNGGYLLGLVMQACSIVQAQASTGQIDPLHLSTVFVGSCSPGPCVVSVKRLKEGKTYTNLSAELSQAGRVNIHCQLLYGTLKIARHPLGSFPGAPGHLTHPHPHALSRRCPLATHPSKCTIVPFTRPLVFQKHVVMAHDPYYVDIVEGMGEDQARVNEGDLGGGGAVWGGWFQMLDEGDVVVPEMMPFLGDCTPDLLPSKLIKERGLWWVPTLALSVDFKYRLPTASSPERYPGIELRTIGVFTTSRFLIDGRHDLLTEIWTAPSRIGEGVEEAGWQDRMFCMASATQSALTLPPAVNQRKGKTASTSKL